MTDRLAHMEAEDISKLIDYIVKHDTGNKTVGAIKTELGLTEEEFYELYTLAMPAIRGFNEGRFWRVAYCRLEACLERILGNAKTLEGKIADIKETLKSKSMRMLEEERQKGWDAA